MSKPTSPPRESIKTREIAKKEREKDKWRYTERRKERKEERDRERQTDRKTDKETKNGGGEKETCQFAAQIQTSLILLEQAETRAKQSRIY
jgi:hypothetical protein